MNVILFGAPGAGKGTQADFISKYLHITPIATGDILRRAVADNTEIGKKIKMSLQKGELSSDDLILELIKERIAQKDCQRGFLCDGFPRTLNQAKLMEQYNIKIDIIIELKVNDRDIVGRLSGRRVHLASGRVYHVEHNPPIKEGKDDITGEPLIQREDDYGDVILTRLNIYHKMIKELSTFYKEKGMLYYEVNGNGTIDEVKNRIVNIFKTR